MTGGKLKSALLPAVLMLVFGSFAVAELIVNEIVTITLDDGTIIHCILSDSGVQSPEADEPLQMLDFSYLRQTQQIDISQVIADRVNHGEGRFFWNSSAKLKEYNYYYLPPPPHISVDEEGRPKFLFVKFVTDKTEEQGGVSGGIVHFLCEYGLTQQQEVELQQKLAAKVRGAKLLGAVPMESGGEDSTFQLISATLDSPDLASKVVATGRAPLMPGLRVACAARLTPYGARLLEETLKMPTGDISIQFSFTYTAHAPALKGKIQCLWSKLREQGEYYSQQYEEQYKYKPGFVWIFPTVEKHTSYTDTEVQHLWDFMFEHEMITIELSEGIADERVEAIRELFLNTLASTFFERAVGAGELEGDEESDLKPTEIEMAPEKKGANYRFTRYRSKNEYAYSDRTININYRLPVEKEYTRGGNISGAWYLTAVEKYPELFREINLDDPFFQRRMVIFTLDLDTSDIFKEAINFVTIEVKKDRKSGDDFHDSITVTQKELEKSGVSFPVYYAKMREDDPEVFDYMVRWSLRGGVDYPANPNWQRGSWEGVTLGSPIRSRDVEAEIDIDDMEQNDVVRVTVQLRYTKYSRTYEDPETIQLSIAKGEPIKSMRIYYDYDRPEYQYRVTYYHKTEGRVSGDWERGANDGYIYCVLPEELRKGETE